MLCPIILNSNTFELAVHTSCYLVLRLTLCYLNRQISIEYKQVISQSMQLYKDKFLEVATAS